MKTRYKFLKEIGGKIKSANGDLSWSIGEWQHEKKLDMCHAGPHCSKEIGEAFSYVQGEVLAEVEVKGKHESQDDKEVWTDMRIVKAWKWQKKDSVALAIFAAELVLENFENKYPDDKRPREAIEAAKKFIEDPTDKNRSAAWSAESAARSAAWSAAWSAARSARSAARSAESAAWSAESAESAARSARSAARSAESAAWSAESAARSAASAAKKKITKKIHAWFDEHLKELEPYES